MHSDDKFLNRFAASEKFRVVRKLQESHIFHLPSLWSWHEWGFIFFKASRKHIWHNIDRWCLDKKYYTGAKNSLGGREVEEGEEVVGKCQSEKVMNKMFVARRGSPLSRVNIWWMVFDNSSRLTSGDPLLRPGTNKVSLHIWLAELASPERPCWLEEIERDIIWGIDCILMRERRVGPVDISPALRREAKTIILRLERKWGSDKSHKSCPVKSHTELRVGWELIGKKLLIFCLFTLILHYWMYSYTSALGAISDGRRLAAEGQQCRLSRPGPDSVYSGEEDRAAVTLSSTTC